MSLNSLHQNNPDMSGGFYGCETEHENVVINTLNPKYVFARNYKNAGHTAFNEETVQVGYMKARGIAGVAGLIIGYRGAPGARAHAVRVRVRNMGPHKLREMHESMKTHGLCPDEVMHTGPVPVFYTFERLLQLFFHDYKAVKIPARIRNWVPEEGSFWYHWWKARQ